MYQHELAFANGLADRSADIGYGLFHGDGLEIRRKADRTVVTQADISIEAMVREQVAAAFPDDHVLGEEEGGDDRSTGRVWIVDPIDATANYARGIPIWATLIALQVDGDLVLGLVSAPAIGERYEAVRGGGARMNGRVIRVSEIDRLADAQLFWGGMGTWLDRFRDGVLDLMESASRTRGFGDFWGHALVARGAGEAMMEPELNIWDYAAFQVVVEEAGGRVTQVDGSPTRHGGSAVSSNGVLHDEILERLSG
ncbi:MAG: histidinol-phosphatase [Actinomycetota bacterium]|nr:histidinol-phosphatase [Actinomycetota bacterium]MDH5313580.1 histidinol-phosphatase [Actinomycetota bacterium]